MAGVVASGSTSPAPAVSAGVGVGCGLDVRSALHFGAKHVDAVEINPSIVREATTTFDRFAGGLYHDPAVRLVHSEGRHFLRRQRKRYDVIQISGVDTFAASQAGAGVRRTTRIVPSS